MSLTEFAMTAHPIIIYRLRYQWDESNARHKEETKIIESECHIAVDVGLIAIRPFAENARTKNEINFKLFIKCA